MTERLIAIDPASLSMGWAVFKKTENGWVYEDSGTIKVKGNVFKRLGNVWREIRKIARKYRPNYCHIERLNYRTRYECIWSVGVIGAAIASASDCAVAQDVSPNTWKKHVGYENPASKFHKTYSDKVSSLDELVAIAIGLYVTEVHYAS